MRHRVMPEEVRLHPQLLYEGPGAFGTLLPNTVDDRDTEDATRYHQPPQKAYKHQMLPVFTLQLGGDKLSCLIREPGSCYSGYLGVRLLSRDNHGDSLLDVPLIPDGHMRCKVYERKGLAMRRQTAPQLGQLHSFHPSWDETQFTKFLGNLASWRPVKTVGNRTGSLTFYR